MLVECFQGVFLLLRQEVMTLRRIECNAFYGIFIGKALGTRQLVKTVIGLGTHDVVLYFNDLALCRADQRGGMISVTEIVAYRICTFTDKFLSYHRFRVHSHKHLHTVSPMDVESLGYGTKTVGRIDIAPVTHIIVKAPAQTVVLTRFPILVPIRSEIMYIGTLGPDNLAE